MRFWPAALAIALASCGHNGTIAGRVEGEDFSRYHHMGILPFVDAKGQGLLITDEIKKAMEKRMFDSVDTKALEQVLSKYRIDRGEGLGAEALEDIRSHAPVDSIVIGAMIPDWSAARLVMVETDMGEPIMRAVLKPKNGKFFRDAEEVVDEAVKVLTDPKYGN